MSRPPTDKDRPRQKPGFARGAARPPVARPRAAETDPDGPVRIWGLHAVEAALNNERRVVRRLALTENAERRLAEAIAAKGASVERASPRDLDRDLGTETVHQGALLEAEPLPEPSLEDLIALSASTGGPLVVLDQVTDPHNVGAILRSAAVFGAAGMIMTRRHSPPLSGALAKTASGALELVPIALVGNLARTLAELGEAGVARIGLDGEAEAEIGIETFGVPSAIVLGAEGKGLRRLTRELCDRLVRIGAAGALASLNVSNAAAVALYAASRRQANS